MPSVLGMSLGSSYLGSKGSLGQGNCPELGHREGAAPGFLQVRGELGVGIPESSPGELGKCLWDVEVWGWAGSGISRLRVLQLSWSGELTLELSWFVQLLGGVSSSCRKCLFIKCSGIKYPCVKCSHIKYPSIKCTSGLELL